MIVEAVLVIVALFAYFYHYVTRQFDFFKARGVPFLTPSFPFGSSCAKDMIMGKISYFHMEKQAAKEFPNEKVFGIFIFGQPQFIINDIELAKRVMIKDFEHFSGLRDFDQNSKVSKLFMSSLDGDDWKRMRSMMSGVFTTGKLKLMATHIAKVGENFEDHIEGIKAHGDSEVSMKKLASYMTLDGLATAAFGIETNSFENPTNEFRVKALKLVGNPEYSSKWRVTKVMIATAAPKLAKLLKIQVFPEDCETFFAKILQAAYKHRMESGYRRNDIIDMMIDEIKNEKESQMAYENEHEKDAVINTKGLGTLRERGYDPEALIVANALMMFFVGFDTTSMGVTMVAHSLALYPDLQEKVLNELDDVVGSKKAVTYEDLQKLTYLDHFINEVYRCNDVFHAHERKCTKDYRIPDTEIVIPKDRYVKVYFDPFTKRSDFFMNPDEFDPENFLPENKPNKFGSQFFGHGPRNCIGMRYANLMVKMTLVYLLKRNRLVQGPQFQPVLESDPKHPTDFVGGVFVKIEDR